MLVFSMHSTPVISTQYLFISTHSTQYLFSFFDIGTLWKKKYWSTVRKGADIFYSLTFVFDCLNLKTRRGSSSPKLQEDLHYIIKQLLSGRNTGNFCKAGLVDAAPAQLGAADDLGSYTCCDRERAACAIKSLHEAWTRLGKNLGFGGF